MVAEMIRFNSSKVCSSTDCGCVAFLLHRSSGDLQPSTVQTIPADFYEAAQIDGASNTQKLIKITFPIILFETAPLLIGQYTFNFNNFSIIYLFNTGGPLNPVAYGNLAGSSDILISYVYKLMILNQQEAVGAAITVLITTGLMVFTFIVFRNSKTFNNNKL